jgi:hypothetical protein
VRVDLTATVVAEGRLSYRADMIVMLANAERLPIENHRSHSRLRQTPTGNAGNRVGWCRA